MKRMLKSDLVIVLTTFDEDRNLSIAALICLFDAFGDDWVIGSDLQLIKTSENKAMAALRKE